MTRKEKDKLKKDAAEYICPHFADYNEIAKGGKIFVKGEGSYLYDIDGNRYLDTFASLLTTIVGHTRREIIDAIEEQLNELEFFPNYVDTYTVPLIKLAKKLADIMPGDLKVSFYVNSGSEACETAIKMAKQYHWEKGERSRYKIIGRRYSYHGTTLGGISATGIPWFKEPFQPLLPGFIHGVSTRCYRCELGLEPATCRLACLKSLEKLIEWEGPNTVAGVIIDPIPGSNIGYPLPPDGYLQGLRELCDKHGILLIFDEVQTGFGKSGKWFACEHWNVAPDIIAIGKGFSGGYIPLGATIATEKIYSIFRKPGSEFRSGSTFGGHTVACAAALANIELIEKEKLVEKTDKMGKYLKKELDKLYKYPIVGDIRGIGLLWAIEMVADKKTGKPLDSKLKVGSWIRDYCWNRNMILRNNGDILVLAPALTIKNEQIDEALNTIDNAIESAIKHFKF
ncbi:MAG: aspartate aminotransferase family protein [Candidatus Omnitrophica bacterium]|nr:aspartate aminotransferase family protein [Candidatus Omnitrophota bacterium]